MITSTPIKKPPLVERTRIFATAVRAFARAIPYNSKIEGDLKQLLRSSGSIGANYLEAQEAISRSDFVYRIRVARKEANESQYWLCIIKEAIGTTFHGTCDALFQESKELTAILTTIAKKVEKNL